MTDTLIKLINTYGLWILGILVAWKALQWHWRAMGRSLNDPTDLGFRDYQARLRVDTWVDAYHRLLQNWLLALLDRWLQDEYQQTCHPGGRCDRLFGIQPWTAKSYAFCLRLAIIYPLALVFCVWLFGFAGRLGDVVLLLATTPGVRLGGLIWLSVLVFALYRSTKMTGWKAFGFRIAVVAAVAGAVAVDIAIDIADVGVAIAMVVFIFIAVIAIVASMVAYVVGRLIKFLLARYPQHKTQLTIWLSYTGLILLSLFSLLVWFKPLGAFQVTLLVFLGLLPLLNTVWDWCSLGLTRGLLAGIVKHKHPGLWACG